MTPGSFESCTVPFTSLIVEPDGGVSACRHKGLRQKVGDLRTETLREVWNGPRIRAWRRDFIQGTKSICRREMDERHCHHRDASYSPETELSELQSYPPRRIGLNLNGKCNLRCPMCEVWRQPNGFYRQPHVWRQIEEILPDVREIEMLGGEPFVQGDVYRVMKQVAKVNPTCEWLITTNATWKLSGRVRERLDPLRFRTLLISADSLVSENYARIRPPATLDQFLATIEALCRYEDDRLRAGRPSLKLGTNMTIQKVNWREVPELVKFDERYPAFHHISLSLLYLPSELSILSEDLATRERMLMYLIEHIEPRHFSRAGRIIRPLLRSVSPLFRASVLNEISGAFA